MWRRGDLLARTVDDVDDAGDAFLRGLLPLAGAALVGATYADSQGWDSDDRHHDSGSGWFGDSGADAGGGSGWFGGGDSGGGDGGGGSD